MSDNELAALLAVIEQMGLAELRTIWARHCGAPIPPLRSGPILRMLLAWRLQSKFQGGLDADTRRTLGRSGPVKAEGLDLGIGARLTRSWQGRTHAVVVEADGFSWEGRRYRSLSAVASAIAGSRWNGPRFFGLRDAG
jgi:hypothetical protein